MKKTYPDFFFGALSRPLMIGLEEGFTYFDLRFCDCTGLSFEGDNQSPYHGQNMRTPRELAQLVGWLLTLAKSPPHIEEGNHLRVGASIPGFSPEFESESSPGRYDATELNLHALFMHGMDNELCLFLEDCEPDDVETAGIPVRLLPQFAAALLQLAAAWDNGGLDLRKSQPMAARKSRKRGPVLMLEERRAA
ncbi:MAG: hypothetical protein V4662_11910 [Verrucomicrobiota bacterium]